MIVPFTRRRGFTLIEMLTVMVGVTTIIGLAIVAMQSILVVNERARRDLADRLETERLVDRFRVVARGAESVRAEPDGPGPDRTVLRFDRANGAAVVFRVRDGRLEVERLDTADAPARPEPYRITRPIGIRLELVEFEGRRLATLVLEPAGGVGRVARIEAIVAAATESAAAATDVESTP